MEVLISFACISIYIIIGSFLKEVFQWDEGDGPIMICFWPVVMAFILGMALVRRFIEAGEKLAKILKNARRKTK